MNETEISRMLVRLLGDGSLYTKMCGDAVKDTQQAATKITTFGKVIEGTQKVLEGFGRTLTRVGQGIRSIGTLASVGITAPVTALAGVATNEFNQFESALSRMKGLVGLTDETILEFKGHILDLAKDVGKAPLELAKAMENITSSGIQGAAAIETLDITARAAAGGLGEVRSVSDTVTSAMNAYGVANLSATKATDILVAAVREGKAEADTFAPVLGNVLPIANEMGISFDEAAGSIAYLTLATGSAATAATQYQNILAQTLKLNPEKEAGKNLTKLGIDVKGFQKSVGSEGLLPSLMKLKDELAKTGHTLKDAFPDVQAMTAALQLTGANSAKAAQVLESVANAAGSVDKAFDAAAQTTQHQLNKAMAEMKVILIEIGEMLVPIFAKFTSGLGSVMQFWKQLTPASKQLVITTVALAAAVGPLLIGLGTLVSFAGSLVTGFTALAVATPTAAYGLALVVAGIADVGMWIYIFRDFIDVTKLWGMSINWLGKQWQNLVDYVAPAIEGIKNAIAKGDIKLAVDILWVAIKISFNDGIIALNQLWGDFKYSTAAIWKDISNGMVIEWTKGVDLMELKQREFIAFMTGTQVTEKFKLGQLQDQSGLADKLGEERAKVLGDIREATAKGLAPMHAETNKLRDKMKYLTDLAKFKLDVPQIPGMPDVAKPVLGKDIIPPGLESEIDKIQEKAHIKVDMKFDAAGAGTAEAASRIRDYMSNLGIDQMGGVKVGQQKKKNYGQGFAWEMLTEHANQQNAKAVQSKIDIESGSETWEQMKTLLERAVQALENPKPGQSGDFMVLPSNFA